MKYVIIGASAAGAQAAEELRKLDDKGTITLISEEESPPYSRCLISRYVDGRLKSGDLYFKTADFFRKTRVEAILGKRAIAIDRAAHSVRLSSGENISYDKLLLATGSRPWRPEIPGSDRSGVFNFHSLSDAAQIDEAAKMAGAAVVVGAGFAGLEAAYSLKRRGLAVTVVERCSQILPNQLDREGGDIIQQDLASLGIVLNFNQSIVSIDGNDNGVESVVLGDNDRISCELVIFATGTRPNKELAVESGLTVDRGIIVDDTFQTSDHDIFAAGDVIEINDTSTGKRVLSATWFNAVLQGRFVAYNMAGKLRRYTDAIGIQNAVQFHRIPAISFGKTTIDPQLDDDCEVLSIRKNGIYKKLVLKGNRIAGMIFVGDISKSGFYNGLIRSGADINAYRTRLLDDDFSHALFARGLTFGQYDPYRDTAPGWDAGQWWVGRTQCITA